MKSVLKKLSNLILVATYLLTTTLPALAKVGIEDTIFGYSTNPSHLPTLGSEAETAEQSIGIVFEKFTQYLFAFAGAIAIYFIIMAGFKLMLARGEEEKVTKAHQMLFWSIVGFLLIILAYALVVNISALVFETVGR